MNEQELDQEKEEATPSKPLHHRRARRTLAPFSQENVSQEESVPSCEEKVCETTEEDKNGQTDDVLNIAPLEEAEAVEEKENAPLEAVEQEEAPNEVNPYDDCPAPEEKKKTDEEEKLSGAAGIFDWIKSFLFSLTVVVFVFTLIFRGVTVDGNSMLPTLENNEYLIISDLFYTPKTGDIVVVQSPHYKNGTEPIIKRVIATGGQVVRINFHTWEVFVDGDKLDEDYILKMNGVEMNPEDMTPDENGIVTITVNHNCVFVMGDNRNDSMDSRDDNVGQIDTRYIMGRVILRAAPVSRFGKVD